MLNVAVCLSVRWILFGKVVVRIKFARVTFSWPISSVPELPFQTPSVLSHGTVAAHTHSYWAFYLGLSSFSSGLYCLQRRVGYTSVLAVRSEVNNAGGDRDECALEPWESTGGWRRRSRHSAAGVSTGHSLLLWNHGTAGSPLTFICVRHVLHSSVPCVMGRQVLCEANQNGSQALCDLGNPVKRDAAVQHLSLSLLLYVPHAEIQVSSLFNPGEILSSSQHICHHHRNHIAVCSTCDVHVSFCEHLGVSFLLKI